jgi:uncharacterized protein YecE (DUF72 family)
MRSGAASILSPRPASSGAVLAQFPPSFKRAGRLERHYLVHLLRALGDYGRRRSAAQRLSDAFSDTLDLLNEAHAAWVQIDEPSSVSRFSTNRLPNVKGFYTCACTDGTRSSGGPTRSPDRYNYLYRRTNCGSSATRLARRGNW